MMGNKEIVAAIVSAVWSDDVAIVGRQAFDQLLKSSELKFQYPVTGDHVDLMPVIELLKSLIELISVAATLYFLIRDKPPSKGGENDHSDQAETAVRDKLRKETVGGEALTSSQIDAIIDLLKKSKSSNSS